MKDFAKSIVCNTKVGNGSGDWRGNFYEDNAGNSATVMKSGKGWEVFWEDARGYGKLVGVYKDQNTAKKVAEEVVETEMPDRIKANYRSQAINSKVGNKRIKGNYVTIDTASGRVTFDDFAGKSFDITRIDSAAGYELRIMQQQMSDFKKAIDEAKSLAKQNGLI